MLVEDTTAFIEQLEVQRQDRRSEKRRRRRAQTEVAALRAEWEASAALEAVRKMEEELAQLPEPAGTPGRRLLEARRRRSLEHRIDSMRRRARAKQEESLAARGRLRELDGNTGKRPAPGAKVFRLHSAQHHLECSERRFTHIAGSQAEVPVLVGKREGRSWWWYADRFWWDEDGLRASDVRVVVLDGDLRARQRAQELAEARATLLGEERPVTVDASASPLVRFAVWCRDRGRCVDCGTQDDVIFDEIIPPDAGGAKAVANVELRCGACRERRRLNRSRARVGRAQVAASHDL